MGDKLSKDFSIAEEYSKLSGMPNISSVDFEVELEKECYMSVNVIRNNPSAFKAHFEHVMSLKGMYKGKSGKKFLKALEKMPSVAPLSLDHSVMNACKMNNEALKMVVDPNQISKDGNARML